MKKCPNCNTIMNEVLKIEVIIDVCPSCMGIWLDKGELEKITAIIERTENSNNQREYNSDKNSNNFDRHNDDDYKRSKHYDDDDRKYYNEKDKYGYPRKKKGGLADIFGNLFD